MATYQPAKRATAWVGYISLVDQSDTKKMKSNPTIASGDFKVSKDGGALANLTTLPSVTPASSVMVKIDLSATEMTADNVTVVCIDAAGAEWCDLVFNLQPSARQIDDLAYPATSGRSMVVDANGLVDANAVKVGPSGSGTAQTAGDLAAMVTAVDDFVDTEVSAIKAKTDNLPGDPADASDIAAAFATVNATLGTPAGASIAADIAAVKVDTAAILVDTGTTLDGKIDAIDNFIDTEIADIQARLPAALTAGGHMKADALAVSGSTGAADKMEALARTIVEGVCDTGGTTTAIVASSLTPASTVNDQFNGLLIKFADNTTTAALRGQGTRITDFVHATQTFTVDALTTAPATGDVFTVS